MVYDRMTAPMEGAGLGSWRSEPLVPFADGTFDAVVSTLVLCSVRDPASALAAAGCDVSGIERGSIRQAPPLVRPGIRGAVGVAR